MNEAVAAKRCSAAACAGQGQHVAACRRKVTTSQRFSIMLLNARVETAACNGPKLMSASQGRGETLSDAFFMGSIVALVTAHVLCSFSPKEGGRNRGEVCVSAYVMNYKLIDVGGWALVFQSMCVCVGGGVPFFTSLLIY